MRVALPEAYNEALGQYTKKMQEACSSEARSMPQNSLRSLHNHELRAAGATYRTKAKHLHANSHDIDHDLEQLTAEINEHEQQYFNQNVIKSEKTTAKALDAFYKRIERVTQSNTLCLNSTDVNNVHAEAVQDAEKAFREDRVKGYGPDWDRHFLIDYLLAKNYWYQLLNTKNNKHIGLELAIKYFQEMASKCTREQLSNEAFNTEHEKARVKALAEFAARRNRPNKFRDDVLKYKVEQSIMVQYSQLKQFNASAGNKTTILQSVSVYEMSATSPSVLWQYSLHPEDLKKDHDDALCRALRAFRPNRTCSEGFHDSKKDELDLHLIFKNRYRSLADINTIANQIAEETGFLEFRFKFNTLAGSNWFSMSMHKRREYYSKAIIVGLDAFHGKRPRDKSHDVDCYKDQLIIRCKNYAQVDQEYLKLHQGDPLSCHKDSN